MINNKCQEKTKKYKYAILGSSGHGKTTLYYAIKKFQKLKGLEFDTIYNDALIGSMKVRNLIPILEQIEKVILIISAEEGLNPQTRELTLLSRQLGIEKMIVYVNKVDKVPKVCVDKLIYEIQRLMQDYDYIDDNLVIAFGSAKEALNGLNKDWSASEYESIIQVLN